MYFRIIKKKHENYQKFCRCLYKYINRYAVYFWKENQELTTIARVVCLAEIQVSEGTYGCIVLSVSVLSLALLYVSAERIHVLCVCFSHRHHLFNLFNNYSFAVGHMKHSQFFICISCSRHDVQMCYFKCFQVWLQMHMMVIIIQF